MSSKYSTIEKTLKSINDALFYDKDKVNKLWNNILYVLDKLEENALTIWIVWEWWSWKTSFLNILLENITNKSSDIKYFFEDTKCDNYYEWTKIQNKIKQIKLWNEVEINKEKLNTNELYVLNINSWLISNIVSDPLYNLVSLLSKELDLKLDTNIEKAIKTWKKFWNLTAWVFNRFALKADDQELEVWIPKFTDVANNILELKEKFNKNLNEKLWDKNKLIIIIDDLDRIAPEDAVTILDSIKLFLDNPNILIFLLNDKDIVKRWLKNKLNLEWDEIKKIAGSYLDKLISIEIDITKYYNKEAFFKSIEEFISWNKFLTDISSDWTSLTKKIIEDKEVLEKLYQIKNMRRIKKLLNNFRVQAPSIVEYDKNNKTDMVNKYFDFFQKMLDEYVKEEKDNNNKNNQKS